MVGSALSIPLWCQYLRQLDNAAAAAEFDFLFSSVLAAMYTIPRSFSFQTAAHSSKIDEKKGVKQVKCLKPFFDFFFHPFLN